MSSDSNVARQILLCVDEVLGALGRGASRAARDYLKKSSSLQEDRIVKEPEFFCKELKAVLGERSAELIESSIAQRLASSFELKAKKSGLSLVETIIMIRDERENP